MNLKQCNKDVGIEEKIQTINQLNNLINNKKQQKLKETEKKNPEQEKYKEELKAIQKKLKEKFITYGALDDLTINKLYSILPKLSLYNQCMILIFLECGVRVNELIHIKTKNVNLTNRCIFLEYTKTNKPRYVYFSVATRDLLKVYIENKTSKSMYLFTAKKSDEILSRYTINGIFSRIRKKYNFPKLSPHMIRHTLSTKLYNNGANILFICSIMGHSNPNTTKRYVHNDLANDLKMFDTFYR